MLDAGFRGDVSCRVSVKMSFRIFRKGTVRLMARLRTSGIGCCWNFPSEGGRWRYETIFARMVEKTELYVVVLDIQKNYCRRVPWAMVWANVGLCLNRSSSDEIREGN